MAEQACVDLAYHNGGDALEGLTADSVQATYRAAAKATHPDAGGSAEAFAKVDRAKHVLLKWLEREAQFKDLEPKHGEKCRRCDGKGYVESARAFRTMRVACPLCRGLGEEGVESEKGHDS